jgi:hypothetical protein
MIDVDERRKGMMAEYFFLYVVYLMAVALKRRSLSKR